MLSITMFSVHLRIILLISIVSFILSQQEKYEYCKKLVRAIPTEASDMDIELAAVSCGLFPFLPKQLEEYPRLLQRYAHRGIGIWQNPIQFSRYLNFIRSFPFTTYVEIGTGSGGTFIFTTEFLKNYSPLLLSYALDAGEVGFLPGWENIYNPYNNILLSYLQDHLASTVFIQGGGDTLISIFPNVAIDILYINGYGRSYAELQGNFNQLALRSKMFVFQGITDLTQPETRQFWEDMKSAYPSQTIEFVDQYDELNPKSFFGMGVLINPMFYVCTWKSLTVSMDNGTSIEQLGEDKSMECFQTEQ
jgi:hypothetical protein